MSKETFYQQDSLSGQTLRVVKVSKPGKLDIYTSDASTDGSVHDHNFINYRTDEAGSFHRGQQKTQ